MAVNTITIGAGTLTIGATGSLMDFSGQCTAARLVPSVENGDPIDVLSGEQAAGDRSESWALSGTMLQDLGATSSTTAWLFDHRGEEHDFSYTPNTGKGTTFSGRLTVEAIEMGGDVKTKPTSDFEFQLVGPPVMGDGGTEAFAFKTTAKTATKTKA